MDLKTSWPKLLFAGVIAVIPAALSYCKSSQEADHARIEADAGYRTLVQSVRNLEMVVAAQNNAISLLTDDRVNGASFGSAAAGSGEPVALPAPNFTVLPDSTAAALRMQGAEPKQ